MRSLRRLLTVLAIAIAPANTEAVDIFACGTSVPDHDVGVLQNDLECTASFPAVTLLEYSTLDLNGFTIHHAPPPPPMFQWENAVSCIARCSVVSHAGQGRILGESMPNTIGVRVRGPHVRIENVEIDGFEVWAGPPIPITDPIRLKVHAIDVTLRNLSEDTAWRKVVRGERLQVSDTVRGVGAKGAIKLEDLACSGAADYCVGASRVRLERAVVDTSAIGVSARAATLIDSTVTSNTVDLKTRKLPRLVNSTCDVSEDHESPPGTWGVCALD